MSHHTAKSYWRRSIGRRNVNRRGWNLLNWASCTKQGCIAAEIWRAVGQNLDVGCSARIQAVFYSHNQLLAFSGQPFLGPYFMVASYDRPLSTSWYLFCSFVFEFFGVLLRFEFLYFWHSFVFPCIIHGGLIYDQPPCTSTWSLSLVCREVQGCFQGWLVGLVQIFRIIISTINKSFILPNFAVIVTSAEK